MKALIIDDDLLTRKALSYYLLELDNSVHIAVDGKEALRILEKEGDFNLIFVDVMMPVLTGPTFIEVFRKRHSASLPYIVLMSSARNIEDLVDNIHVEYDQFMSKPFDFNEIESAIRHASHRGSTSGTWVR